MTIRDSIKNVSMNFGKLLRSFWTTKHETPQFVWIIFCDFECYLLCICLNCSLFIVNTRWWTWCHTWMSFNCWILLQLIWIWFRKRFWLIDIFIVYWSQLYRSRLVLVLWCMVWFLIVLNNDIETSITRTFKLTKTVIAMR